MAHINNAFYHSLIGLVFHQVIHQGFIQLYLVKLHDGKNGHIGIVGPKVVQGDAKSRFPEF